MKWGIACFLVSALIGSSTGCVTVAEFRKLENEMIDLKRSRSTGGLDSRERLAELAARVEAVEQEADQLGGRLEVAEYRSAQALEEARSARQAAATGTALSRPGAAATPDLPGGSGTDPGNLEVSLEVAAYRDGYAEWRNERWNSCIDRFRDFLQTYPSSAYADDAAYWLADCYFKQGDYKTAILRFDDVVTTYPDGNKAAEALYRQGEALLRLGPGFGKAAGKAFERVVEEYPQSGRATEAKRQLEMLGTG